MIAPYPDEAVSSWVRRMVLRGRLPPSIEAGEIVDLTPPPKLIAAARTLGEGAHQSLAQLGLRREWPASDVDDLMILSGRRYGKACRACLEEDVVGGRDQYFRQEWLFVWRITCPRHGLTLQEITSCVLAPVHVDGEPTSRVRLLRDVDLQNDPFLRPGRAATWRSRKDPPLYVIAFEQACIAALAGGRLDDFWCCGSQWAEARPLLIDLVDLLVSPGRGDQRPLHVLPNDVQTPAFLANHFSARAMDRFSPIWHVSCMHALATSLADPTRFELILERQFFDAFLTGRRSTLRQASRLGRLALKDPLALVFGAAFDSDLQRFMLNVDHWPSAFLARARSAATVALCLE